MCARTTLTRKRLRDVADELEAEFSEVDAGRYRPRYNAAPSDMLWVLRAGPDRRAIGPATWGYRAGGRSLINVRGEQVGVGGGFREAFAARRCGVVCDGFFEWDRRPAPPGFTARTAACSCWAASTRGQRRPAACRVSRSSPPAPTGWWRRCTTGCR
jgi:putative SOS response-associated peptidase YedK